MLKLPRSLPLISVRASFKTLIEEVEVLKKEVEELKKVKVKDKKGAK